MKAGSVKNRGSRGIDFICISPVRQILIFILIVLPFLAVAQNNIGLKYFGMSIHPEGEESNAFLMPHKLDHKGYLVLNLGGEVSYEHFLIENFLSLKLVQALYADCAAQLGGFSHIGIRLKIFDFENHSLYGGIGPTLVFRKNWLQLEGYVNLHRFKGSLENKWQYLFLWYGGELEYKYKFRPNLDFGVSLVPGYPDLISLAFGIHYKI